MDGWDHASPRVRKDFLNKVRTRWRSMKDRFNRDIRQESQVRSGAAARTGTKYRYHRALAFLRPVLASRTTWSSTLQPGPKAVLHQAAPDPSQPSISEEAPCRSAPQSSGDQEAGRSGVPLSQVSATVFAGTSRQQRQRTSDRPLMPEFVELSSVFQSSLKALSDRLESGFLLLDQRYKSIEGRLERLEVDLARPAHHFYTQIARDTAEHLTPDLQLTVMQPATMLLCRLCSREMKEDDSQGEESENREEDDEVDPTGCEPRCMLLSSSEEEMEEKEEEEVKLWLPHSLKVTQP
ncbi:uncharacterized protein [Dendrobates tinctorius]|uniref:uncharacterized protein n=1 Tax=Dendrobates tinctorius TaxID=92724 RepID=UPI003CC9D076